MSKGAKALELVEEALLHAKKPYWVSTAVRKLEVVAELINDDNLRGWCRFNLGHRRQVLPERAKDEDVMNYIDKLNDALEKNGLRMEPTEIFVRLEPSGGGFASIEFIEDRYEYIKKLKHGNDGTYYSLNLAATISETANSASRHAARLYATLGFGDLPRQHFDAIREKVDRLLLDICPEAIEQFMTAYERLAGKSGEDWSLALTACRRVIKTLADAVFPAREQDVGGRKMGDAQYINRLWAYLDAGVAASSDKDLTKAHVDYLGTFISRLNDKASKGVHSSVNRSEAIKAVTYTYLTLGDLLELAPPADRSKILGGKKVDLNSATLEELTSVAGLSGESAKAIIIRRVRKPFVSVDELRDIDGVGPKSLQRVASRLVAFPAKSDGYL